jgi:predicted GNAT superfamily acetyltransferase
MVNGIDLFKEYNLERNGSLTHYDQEMRGFISYSFHNRNVDECFIDDFFIRDDSRGIKRALDLVRFVENQAKIKGCKMLTCACNVSKPDAKRIIAAQNWYGFIPFCTEIRSDGHYLYSAKEII